MTKLKDLVEMYWDGNRAYWRSTPFTNLPHTLIRFKKRVLEGNSKTLPRGTFFMIVPNGSNPTEMLLKRKGNLSDTILKLMKK